MRLTKMRESCTGSRHTRTFSATVLTDGGAIPPSRLTRYGEGKNVLDCLNPDSLQVLTGCKLEASLAGVKAPASFQFIRLGYFCPDSRDSTPEHLVFNRSVSLKDSYKPQ